MISQEPTVTAGTRVLGFDEILGKLHMPCQLPVPARFCPDNKDESATPAARFTVNSCLLLHNQHAGALSSAGTDRSRKTGHSHVQMARLDCCARRANP